MAWILISRERGEAAEQPVQWDQPGPPSGVAGMGLGSRELQEKPDPASGAAYSLRPAPGQTTSWLQLWTAWAEAEAAQHRIGTPSAVTRRPVVGS